MPTTTVFYPRFESAAPSGLTLPSGYLGAWTQKNLAKAGTNAVLLSDTAGSSQVSVTATWSSIAAAGTATLAHAQCCSPKLNGQTIGTGTWTFAFACDMTNTIASTDFAGRAGLYLVNGSTGAIRTTIFTGNLFASNVTAATERTIFQTASGAAFTATSGDYLVWEIIINVRNNTAGSFTPVTDAYSSGATAITVDNVAASDAKTSITSPSSISYQGGANTYNETGSGGVVCGSSATIVTKLNITATGGSVCGGSPTPSLVCSKTATGGSLCGGAASIATTYSITATGGSLCGGAASIATTYSITATGGMVCGSSAIIQEAVSLTAAGGMVCGSSATIRGIINPVASGGVVVGSSATDQLSANVAVSGGAIVGGAATGYALIIIMTYEVESSPTLTMTISSSLTEAYEVNTYPSDPFTVGSSLTAYYETASSAYIR